MRMAGGRASAHRRRGAAGSRPAPGHLGGLLHGQRDLGVAGQLGAAVDAHAARAADGVPAGAPEGQRAVELVLDGHQRLEHGRALGQLDLVALAVAPAAALGVVAQDLEGGPHQ